MANNGLLKLLTGALAGMVVTGIGAWLIFGQDKVTRGELIDYVENQAPWVRERGGVQAATRHNAAEIRQLAEKVDKLLDAQQELLVEQRVLLSKFNNYLTEEKKR